MEVACFLESGCLFEKFKSAELLILRFDKS